MEKKTEENVVQESLLKNLFEEMKNWLNDPFNVFQIHIAISFSLLYDSLSFYSLEIQ